MRKNVILILAGLVLLGWAAGELSAKVRISGHISLGSRYGHSYSNIGIGLRCGSSFRSHFRHYNHHYHYHRGRPSCFIHRTHPAVIHVHGAYWPRYRTTRVYHYYTPPRTTYIYEERPRVIVRERPEVVVLDRSPVMVREPRVRTAAASPTVMRASQPLRLVDQVLRGEPVERLAAARKLAKQKDIQAVAALIDVLINDADGQVRTAAAESLGQIGDPLAYEALLRSAEAEQDEKIQTAAQTSAQTLKPLVEAKGLYVSEVFPPMNEGDTKLADYLQDGRFGDGRAREEAADELAEFKGTQAVAALINLMINDLNEEVREEAAESLGQTGDRMALPFLEWSRLHDPDKSTRNDAEESIGKIRDTIP